MWCYQLPPFQPLIPTARLTYFVVRRGNALEHLEALHCLVTTGRLVGHHAAHNTPEDARGRLEVEGTTLGVGGHALAEKVLVLDCISKGEGGSEERKARR